MITNKVAFKEGRTAYEKGLPKSSNPYKKGDVKQHDDFRAHVSWNEGYDYGKKAEIKESKFEQYLLENLAKIRIHYTDGRSEVRSVKQSDVPKWERKVGKYIKKVEEL